MKKKVLIALAIVLVPVLLFVVFGLPVNVPEGFIVPTEKIKCADTMFVTILKKGLPDEIDTGSYDITGSVCLIYYDEQILGMNMTCYYSYRYNGLYSISYSTDFQNYNSDDFVKITTEFMENSFNNDFVKEEYDKDAFVDNEDYCKVIEYLYNYGAVGEYITIDAYEDSGDISIGFVY